MNEKKEKMSVWANLAYVDPEKGEVGFAEIIEAYYIGDRFYANEITGCWYKGHQIDGLVCLAKEYYEANELEPWDGKSYAVNQTDGHGWIAHEELMKYDVQDKLITVYCTISPFGKRVLITTAEAARYLHREA